jgi:hypothetical protein
VAARGCLADDDFFFAGRLLELDEEERMIVCMQDASTTSKKVRMDFVKRLEDNGRDRCNDNFKTWEEKVHHFKRFKPSPLHSKSYQQ